MFIKILDPDLKIEFHGEKKTTFIKGVYEVDRELGNSMVMANFAIEISKQEMEAEKNETENA